METMLRQLNRVRWIMAHSPSLAHFVEAQDPVYRQVVEELAAGAKASHWMWFIFPQLRGLGRSPMAVKFGIASLDEARAYWRHAVLGPRLRECVELLLAVKDRTALQILGPPDDLKFRSSMTLFAHAVPDEPIFKRALAKYFDGREDPNTTDLLARR